MSGKCIDRPYDIPNILAGAALVALVVILIMSAIGCEPPKLEPVSVKYNIVRIEGDYAPNIYFLDESNTLKNLLCVPRFTETESKAQIQPDVAEGEPCYMEVTGKKRVGEAINLDGIIDRKVTLHIRKSDLGKYLEVDALTCMEEPK